MTDREKLIERLREIASLTPPICQHDRPIELDATGEQITVYCKPFEQFQDLLREAADALANGVVVREKGEWVKTREPLGWQEVDAVECSLCHESWLGDEDDSFDYLTIWHFCPNCGADMRKGENG